MDELTRLFLVVENSLVNIDSGCLKQGGEVFMEYAIATSGNQAIVTIKGKIYIQDACIIREEIINKIEAGYHRVLIKLAEVTYMDSAGLSMMVTLHKVSRKRHGSLVVSGVQGMVKDLMQHTHVDQVLRFEGTL